VNWRLVDIFVVVISILDNVVGFLSWVQRSAPSQTESLLASVSILRIVRVLRVVKLARVIRLLSFFRELRLMVNNILNCSKPLLWVILILGMTIYVFAVTLTCGVVSHLDSGGLWRDPVTESLRDSFASLGDSHLTLYMAMAGGKDWGDFYDMLEPVAFQYRVLFLVFLTFTLFALLNVVTGVFVDAAAVASQNNQQTIIIEEMHAKKQYLRHLKEIFAQMDVDHDGTITSAEFTNALQNERVVANFRALKLNADDAVQLFKLLDVDQSGQINVGEFLEGCYELQGETRNIDAKIMKMQLSWLVEQFDSSRSHNQS